MSEISGRLAIEIGAELLREHKGLLLGGTTTVAPANVLILGGGTVGTNAAETALGMDARVIILEADSKRVEELDARLRKFFPNRHFGSTLRQNLNYLQHWCLVQNQEDLKRFLPRTDLLIGAALVPGAKTPHLVTRDMVKTMKPGSVIIDVSIDQGGCVETSHETTLNKPTFEKCGVVHYCVTNIPGSVPHTSTLALTNETLPYIIELADKGFDCAIKENPALAKGVNIHRGAITYPKLAETLHEKCAAL